MNSVSMKDGSFILSTKVVSCDNNGVVKKTMQKKKQMLHPHKLNQVIVSDSYNFSSKLIYKLLITSPVPSNINSNLS
jgi:hypothetical protein